MGSSTGEMLYKPEPLDFGDSDDEEPENWVFIDGQWYVDDDECVIF